MVQETNIDVYSFKEDLTFSANMREPNGDVLADAANQTITLVIYAADTEAILHEFSGSPQVILADPATATWNFLILSSNISSLLKDVRYEYDIWSTPLAGAPRLHQLKGNFKLPQAVPPT